MTIQINGVAATAAQLAALREQLGVRQLITLAQFSDCMAAAPSVGAQALLANRETTYVVDGYGSGGRTYWYSDGARLRPVNGTVRLAHSATPVARVGNGAEQVHATFTIPANGMLAGSAHTLRMFWACTRANGAPVLTIKVGNQPIVSAFPGGTDKQPEIHFLALVAPDLQSVTVASPNIVTFNPTQAFQQNGPFVVNVNMTAAVDCTITSTAPAGDTNTLHGFSWTASF